MQEITLFPSQKKDENTTTNYCLLMLKTVYNESPILFNQLLNNFGFDIRFELKFAQQEKVATKGTQEKNQTSIADGIIEQEYRKIVIETKLKSKDFSKAQIDKYLTNMKYDENSTLLLLSDDDNIINNKFIDDSNNKKIVALSFEMFIQGLKNLNIKNDIIENMITDLEEYFNRFDLLPTWKHKIVVVPAGKSFSANIEYGAYMCPTTYSHEKAKYLGMYKEKAVDFITELDGVVKVTGYDSFCVEYNYVNSKDDALISRAKEIIKKGGKHDANKDIEQEKGVYIFLFGANKNSNADIKKDTPGGLYNKRYFEYKDANSLDEMVKSFEKQKW